MKRLISSLALIAFACQSSTTTGPAAAAVEPETGPDSTAEEARILAQLDEARALIDAGNPYEALVVLDEVQAEAPEDAQAWYVRGTAALAAAELGSAAGDFYLDAQRFFERAAELEGGPDAWFGASRAARMNRETQVALDHARAGLAALDVAGAEVELDQPAARVVIEAVFGAFVDAKQAEQDAAPLFAEAEDRLARFVQEAPEDTWGWTQYANLYQWEGMAAEALAAHEHVVQLTPDDAAAHERLVQLARMAGESAAVLAAYERFDAGHPDHPLSAWYTGIETFNQAVSDLHADRDSIPGFETAESLLAHCRDLEASYEASCKGYEVMCRSGMGWAHYGAGDMEAAQEAFLSMEDVLPGGMEWKLDGSLLSGVMGLQFVADRYAQRGTEFEIEGKAEACAVFDILREYRPEDADFANNAGFFHRDTCVILEGQAKSRLRAAEKGETWDPDLMGYVPLESTEEECAQWATEAEELREAAAYHAQRSYLAYKAAAELAPEDVRVLNDAALVMVYHIRKDVAEMETLLVRAIELGAEQVQDPELSEEELDQLQEAWGDAYQNMGLVYLTLKNDPAQARVYFEKCFEIGPRPRIDRSWVERYALPACDRALAGESDVLEDLDPRLWLHVHP